MAYVPNPDNLPEADHIDRDIYNNRSENLRWTTRAGNLKNSSCGFVRNFRECALYYNGEFIRQFKSVNEACRYASKTYGLSYSTLNKYRKSHGYEIKKCND